MCSLVAFGCDFHRDSDSYPIEASATVFLLHRQKFFPPVVRGLQRSLGEVRGGLGLVGRACQGSVVQLSKRTAEHAKSRTRDT